MSPPRVLPMHTKKPRRNLRGSDALGIEAEWQRPKALFTKARRKKGKPVKIKKILIPIIFVTMKIMINILLLHRPDRVFYELFVLEIANNTAHKRCYSFFK